MTGREINLYELILSAWTNTFKHVTKAQDTADRPPGRVNRDSSSVWLDSLGREFQGCYSGYDQIVLWKGNFQNRREFGLNELLFDISVCQVEKVHSITKGTQLPFVSHCHWQVESELNASNSREITKDFSKLVMGQSDNKLFISSYQGDNQIKVREMCSPIARRCTGRVYLCFIEHPRKWRIGPESPVLFNWKNDDWEISAQ